LIEPIRESNRKWLAERGEAEKARKQLEAKLAEWVRMGRGQGGLLDQVELLEAQRWLNIVDRAGLGYSQDVLALVHRSRVVIAEAAREKEAVQQRELAQAQALAAAEAARAEEAKCAVRRARRFSAVLGATLILSFLTALYALQQKGLAEKQARESSSRELTAAAIDELEIDPERSILFGCLRPEHNPRRGRGASSGHTGISCRARLVRPYRNGLSRGLYRTSSEVAT
jgi:hypothetical protein